MSFSIGYLLGTRQGCLDEQKKAFMAGAAYYKVEGNKTTFVYGEEK